MQNKRCPITICCSTLNCSQEYDTYMVDNSPLAISTFSCLSSLIICWGLTLGDPGINVKLTRFYSRFSLSWKSEVSLGKFCAVSGAESGHWWWAMMWRGKWRPFGSQNLVLVNVWETELFTDTEHRFTLVKISPNKAWGSHEKERSNNSKSSKQSVSCFPLTSSTNDTAIFKFKRRKYIHHRHSCFSFSALMYTVYWVYCLNVAVYSSTV